MTVPQLTEPELRALRMAARTTSRTPPGQWVENHPLGRDYVERLREAGLLRPVVGIRDLRMELTPFAVDTLRAYWIGEMQTRPKVQ